MSLLVAEDFHSIQGEGLSLGTPAVFLRLAGCNLTCSGFDYGCDTKKVLAHSKKKEYEEIRDEWEKKGWLENLKNGDHLVITGGEPLLQQEQLIEFLDMLRDDFWFYVEVETNATILSDVRFLHYVSQINASPKLSNNGDSRKKAYKPEVLKSYASFEETYFKFVVSKESDIQEILEKYVVPFEIEKRRVFLMPEGGTKLTIESRREWLFDMCKKYHMRYSGRLHIETWGEKSGV
jgi:organic radical activating enzyme